METTLNGKKQEFFRANIGFTGLVLPAGNHSIVLEYKAPFRGISGTVSLVAFAAYVLLFFILRKKKTKMVA